MLWAYLEEWIVGDGQLPTPEPGRVLELGLVLRGSRWFEPIATGPNTAHSLQRLPARDGTYRYLARGTVRAIRFGTLALGDVQRADECRFGFEALGFLVHAECRWMRGARLDHGSPLALEGLFAVLAEDEYDETEARRSGVYRPWLVTAVQTEQDPRTPAGPAVGYVLQLDPT